MEKICLTFAYSSPCLFHTASFTTFSFTFICFTYCCLIQISWWDWIASFTNLPQLIYKRDHGTVAGTAVISFQLEILVWTVWVLVGRNVTHNWILQFNFVCTLLGSTDVNRHIYTHINIQWYEKRLHGSPVKSKLDPNDSVACRTSYSTNNLKKSVSLRLFQSLTLLWRNVGNNVSVHSSFTEIGGYWSIQSSFQIKAQDFNLVDTWPGYCNTLILFQPFCWRFVAVLGIIILMSQFGPRFRCQTDGFTYDYRILWHTEEFQVDSMTGRHPAPVAAKQAIIIILPSLCSTLDMRCLC